MPEFKINQINQTIIEEGKIGNKTITTNIDDLKRAKENEDKILTETEKMLELEEETRNDDNLLIALIWQKDLGIDLTELINNIRQTSSAGSITRARRTIQNTEGQLLPTRVGVLRSRKIKREAIESYYGKDSLIYKTWTEDTFLPK